MLSPKWSGMDGAILVKPHGSMSAGRVVFISLWVHGWWFAYHHVTKGSPQLWFTKSFGLPFFCCFSGWVSSSKKCSGVCSWSWYCKLDDKQYRRHGHIHCFILCGKSRALTGIYICASLLSEFPQKRQLYFKSNTFDTVWHVGGPHSEADCSRLYFLQVCYMCFSERYLRVQSICYILY